MIAIIIIGYLILVTFILEVFTDGRFLKNIIDNEKDFN